MVTLADQVGQASNLVGLLLVLLTLFTSEQTRRLAEERKSTGGADPKVLAQIRWLSVGLALVTVASIAVLFPVVRSVIAAIGTSAFTPVLAIFALVWTLLIALIVWQLSIAITSHK